MDIMDLATQMLSSKLSNQSTGSNNDLVQSVIGDLLGGSGNQGIDLGSLVGNLQNSGMADLAASWLGDGGNDNISTSQIEALLGSGKLQQAAAQLGADKGELLAGLQDMLPQVVDKSSQGGNLLDSVGGVAGLAGLASKFLK